VISESSMHLKQTEFLIEDAPTDLILHRKAMVDDGAGGKEEGAPSDLPPQRVRVVGVDNTAAFVTTEGRRIPIHKRLVGMPDLDVELADRFDVEGRSYEVVNVQRDPGWRVEVEARRYG